MKPFMDKDFLLETETARTLYHKYAAPMPIFDYHCHLPPGDIAENSRFSNLYDIWLTGDHYKWRAMRSFGIDERYVTGDASPYEKFEAYASMIPYTIGNPLYHWTHLELQRYFNITTLLSKETAKEIWDEAEKQLAEKPMGARDYLIESNVKAVCTTDDPVDSLEYHTSIIGEGDCPVKVLPTFRPDKALAFGNRADFIIYMKKLSEVSGVKIRKYDDLIEALENRHAYFHHLGGRLSDHALTTSIFAESSKDELEEIFKDLFLGVDPLSDLQVEKLQTAVLAELARMNREKGWTMQIHLGALRNNNSTGLASLGPDTGFDSIADGPIAWKLSRFLDKVNSNGGLPKTILYVLNPSDNYTIGTMIGNFQDGKTAGKIQFGSGWWFNDQRDGMEAQMKALGNLGLLSKFVGMLTDSRSFLSFPRHEYFRRILCNILGNWVEKGEYPNDEKILGEIVQGISFNNAVDYLGVDL
ncbi:glucuronate isomerase [Spirochaeta isovalerica]|uniref:Uronate isomerase n=1 Tax=Spirochaeta isovalerica TaxID=150 RepID=A0A841R8P4_9SPIO|nr:glucuronate isomerase [Spirochaeta isovalerica]MBB6479329.1 glucuronate isomerase [Spirochaeta isovalerica]